MAQAPAAWYQAASQKLDEMQAVESGIAQLPEWMRRLGEAPDASLDVAPIDVLSYDEIGQVARAFDQVHAEAVRLAGDPTTGGGQAGGAESSRPR